MRVSKRVDEADSCTTPNEGKLSTPIMDGEATQANRSAREMSKSVPTKIYYKGSNQPAL
jgi:hypothetical protein